MPGLLKMRRHLATLAAERALARPKSIRASRRHPHQHLHRLSVSRLDELRWRTARLRPDVLALDLVGQGCVAALPICRRPKRCGRRPLRERVLSICVEVCSAAFYLDDDAGVLISACLFGDGAGAAVLSPSANGGRRVKWNSGGSLLKPSDRDRLRFEQKNGMLRNILAPQVPALVAQQVATVFDGALARAGVARSQISGWVLHPGGRDVLLALRERFQFDRATTCAGARPCCVNTATSAAPRFYSSCKRALADAVPGGLWWMSSFGAGFSCHGALLEVE